MSFLNSVLSSIDGSTTPIQAPEVRRTASTTKSKDATQISIAGGKRKAEEELGPPNYKISRSSTTQFSKPATVDSRTMKVSQAQKNKTSEVPTSYKGTGRPVTPTSSSAAVSSKAAPPKKGSFAEVLARAKQNQGPPVVGIIKHKPKEKLSAKKEIALGKELAKKNPPKTDSGKGNLMKNTSELAIRNARQGVKNGDKGTKPSGYKGTSRPANKLSSSKAYQGTAKAKPTASYQGTMKSSTTYKPSERKYHSDSEPTRSKLQPSSKHRRKEEYSDEESEGYGSEDGYTYASEDYSDMDAGFDDLEEEDELAARLARKEDAKEQARLEQLKREKERKKAAMMQGKSKGQG